MIQRSDPPSTSKSVRKWMASGSVTSRFLFSTSFFNLPHLKRQTNTIWIRGGKIQSLPRLRAGQMWRFSWYPSSLQMLRSISDKLKAARGMSLLACRVPLGWAPGCCWQPWTLWGWTVCRRREEPRQSPVCWSSRTASSVSTAYRLQTRWRQTVDIKKKRNTFFPIISFS